MNDVLYKVKEYIQHHKALIHETDNNTISALNFIAEEDISLSRYNDKIIFSTAFERGEKLATFDKKLRKQAVALSVDIIPR